MSYTTCFCDDYASFIEHLKAETQEACHKIYIQRVDSSKLDVIFDACVNALIGNPRLIHFVRLTGGLASRQRIFLKGQTFEDKSKEE